MARINLQLPLGFRFHPSDQELIVHYLKIKVASSPLPASIIAEVQLYQHNPWDLPTKACFGEDEWYFFTPRDRKYPNGDRPNRAAASGYWKATGTDKPILSSCGTKNIGVKKALVFYNGRPPKGIKTDWIMYEYRLVDTVVWNSKRKGSMRLDDWVLCRIRQRNNNTRNPWGDLDCSPHPHPNDSNLPETDKLHFLNMEWVENCLQNFPLLPYLPDTPNLTFSRSCSSSGIELGPENSNETKKDLSESSFDGIFGLFSDSYYRSPEFPTTETVSTLSFAQDNCRQNPNQTAVGEEVSDANNFMFPETIHTPARKKLCNRSCDANEREVLHIPDGACDDEIAF